MVAKHAQHATFEADQKIKHCLGVWTSTNEVSGQPQSIGIDVESNFGEQFF